MAIVVNLCTKLNYRCQQARILGEYATLIPLLFGYSQEFKIYVHPHIMVHLSVYCLFTYE